MQGSIDGGSGPYSWLTGSAWVYGRPNQTLDVAVRTRMTVLSGATQGWSFSLRHVPSWSPQCYGGGVSLTAVTTDATNTATVKNGGPPDFNVTEVESGAVGATQGVMIDTSQAVTLPPTSGFVTMRACYAITMPYYSGYYSVEMRYTHDIGSPEIRSLITQGGVSNVPCQRKFTFNLYVSPYVTPTPTTCWASGAGGGNYGSGSAPSGARPETSLPADASLVDGEAAPEGGASPAQGGGGGGCPGGFVPPPECAAQFLRGDANRSGSIDRSDGIFTLNYLYQSGSEPPCKDAADSNDDERLDLSDAIYLFGFLYVGGPVPPAPYPSCGTDPAGSELGCDFGGICSNDGDGDGLSDECEVLVGTDPGDTDSDNDGFFDGEEVFPFGVNGLNIAELCADPRIPDVYLEIDWFELRDTSGNVLHTHAPLAAALQAGVDAFRDAFAPDPGFALHIDAGAVGAFNLPPAQATEGGPIVFTSPTVEEVLTTELGPRRECFMWREVFRLKQQHFAPERDDVFHYQLWAHWPYPDATVHRRLYGLSRPFHVGGVSVSEQAGDTSCVFFNPDNHRPWFDANQDGVTLEGAVRQEADRVSMEGGAFLHEFGHNLGLWHGGYEDPERSAKPNYSSVMNDRFAQRGVDDDCDWRPDRVRIDYSHEERGPGPIDTDGDSVPDRLGLDESALDESVGICGSSWVDWKRNGIPEGAIDPVDIDHDRDLCGMPEPPVQIESCPIAGETIFEFGRPFVAVWQKLGGFDDWTFLRAEGVRLGNPRNYPPEDPDDLGCEPGGGGAGVGPESVVCAVNASYED